MNKYEHILKSLNFTKIEDSFVLEHLTDNVLIEQILLASQPIAEQSIDKFKKNMRNLYVLIKSITIKYFEQNRLHDQLNINIIYDSGNSEYTMPFEKNFDKIFLEVLRENRDKKLNSIL
jgi:hypothetical protein